MGNHKIWLISWYTGIPQKDEFDSFEVLYIPW